LVVFSFVILYPVHILDYPRYFSCTGVQFGKVMNPVFVVAGTGAALDVPAGGRYLVYQPLLDEGVYRLNGGIPGYSTDFCYGLVAGPADGVLSGAGNQIAVNSELNRRQPMLKYAMRHPVISCSIQHSFPPPSR